jgi:two-component system, cell cycle sensor histidine kinase and response regulator CckA
MAGPTVITILVVDDDSAVLETVRDGLTSFGYEVLAAEGGDAALQIAAEAQHGSITVLLVDVVMPGLNGPEVAERVHAIHPDTKTLFMSGFSNEIVIVHGIKQGDPFIIKPFSLETLQRKIQELLEVRPSPFSRPPPAPGG